MEFPLLPSFWIKLTLNANFSDNSDSQYTVTGKVLTANSFAKANLRRLHQLIFNENYDVVDLTICGLGVIICNNDSLWHELS